MVQCLAQGHLDVLTAEAQNQTPWHTTGPFPELLPLQFLLANLDTSHTCLVFSSGSLMKMSISDANWGMQNLRCAVVLPSSGNS